MFRWESATLRRSTLTSCSRLPGSSLPPIVRTLHLSFFSLISASNQRKRERKREREEERERERNRTSALTRFGLELEFHPYLLTQLQPVLDIHAKHGIVAEAYGPLTPILRHPGGPLKPVLTKLAQKYSVDEGAVLLRWTIQYGVVAVTSSKNPERIKGFTNLWGFELTKDEMKEIEETGRKVHFRHYSVGPLPTVYMDRDRWHVADTCLIQEHMVDEFPVPNLPDGKE